MSPILSALLPVKRRAFGRITHGHYPNPVIVRGKRYASVIEARTALHMDGRRWKRLLEKGEARYET